MDEAEIKQIAEQIANHIMDELSERMKELQPEPLDRIFYTSGEMALKSGVSQTTWCRWVKKGETPQPVMVNGAHKWLAVEVDKWLKKLKRDSSQTLKAAKRDW